MSSYETGPSPVRKLSAHFTEMYGPKPINSACTIEDRRMIPLWDLPYPILSFFTEKKPSQPSMNSACTIGDSMKGVVHSQAIQPCSQVSQMMFSPTEEKRSEPSMNSACTIGDSMKGVVHSQAIQPCSQVSQIMFSPTEEKCPELNKLTQLPDLIPQLLENRISEILEQSQDAQPIGQPNYELVHSSFEKNYEPNSISKKCLSLVMHKIFKQGIDEQSEDQKNMNEFAHDQMPVLNDVLGKLSKPMSLSHTTYQSTNLQEPPMKKKKMEQEKINKKKILNIPSLSILRSQHSPHQTNSLTNSMHQIIGPAPIELLKNDQENYSRLQALVEEKQIQPSSQSNAKKNKFRAKNCEAKRNVASDGSIFYTCKECNLAFKDKDASEQHIEAHILERKYPCNQCGAKLKRKEHLDQHMRGHSDERPFKCLICNRAFKRNEHLTRHNGIHSGDKNFTCSVCNKAFSRKDHLNKHMQTHSENRKNKPKQDTDVINSKGLLDKSNDAASLPRQRVKYFIGKDGKFYKQETTLVSYL